MIFSHKLRKRSSIDQFRFMSVLTALCLLPSKKMFLRKLCHARHVSAADVRTAGENQLPRIFQVCYVEEKEFAVVLQRWGGHGRGGKKKLVIQRYSSKFTSFSCSKFPVIIDLKASEFEFRRNGFLLRVDL